MISIVICSRQISISEELSQNIKNTIGELEYEIICIDNSHNAYSIFQAYNRGVEKAKYPYVCFIHEDILFHTHSWGGVIISKLQESQIGLLGVIGSHYIDQYSQYYHVPGICRGHIIQGEIRNGKYQTNLDNRYQYKELASDVVVVDGLWIASRKELFTKQILYWDENTYKGFHFYDMDICMQAITHGLKVQIVDELLIEHKSMGQCSLDFYDNCIKFHKKWNSYMPVMSTNIPSEVLNEVFIKQIEAKKNTWKELQTYNNILNRTPYKVLTKILLKLGIKLYS